MASEYERALIAEQLRKANEIALDTNRLLREQNAKDRPITSVAELQLLSGNDPTILRQAAAAAMPYHSLEDVVNAVAEHKGFADVSQMLIEDQKNAQRNAGKPRKPAKSAAEILGMPPHEKIAPYRIKSAKR